MRVLFVTSEAYPLAKSGGLADVSRALPVAMRQSGVDVRLVLPGYNQAVTRLTNPKIEARVPVYLGEDGAVIVSGQLPDCDVPVWLVHAPRLYARPGGLYQDRQSRDWNDNPRRFSYFGRVAAAIGAGQLLSWKADIVHANDWHAGLVPFYLAMSGRHRPPTLFTIHNIAFQGNFDREHLAQTGVPDSFFHPEGVEFYGQFSFLKAALRYSDRITTVSPRYRQEVLTQAFGCGFEGLLSHRQKDFSGILNGIENDVWNPHTDRLLPRNFSVRDISGKKACKADLQKRLGLAVCRDVPLLGFSSRLTHQKMADVLVEAIPDILAEGTQLAIIGDGDAMLTGALKRLQLRYPGQLAYFHYDEELAHRLQAGADILLAPARFEPCGLTQLYALRYGTVPVVRKTGGLADTVTDAADTDETRGAGTGFIFDEATKPAFLAAIKRALLTFREPIAWRRLQLAGMSQDFGWEVSARKYIALYRTLSGLTGPEDVGYDVAEIDEPWQCEIRSAQGWA